MTELNALYELADQFRTGTCPFRLGERWCTGDSGHANFYHVTDNGIAWTTDSDGCIVDVHAAALIEAGEG